MQTKAGCDAVVNQFRGREDKLHILVNNSGATWGAPWNDFPEKEGSHLTALTHPGAHRIHRVGPCYELECEKSVL